MVVLNPNSISLFERELQSLSRLRIWTRCRVQHRQFNAILHDIKVGRVFWTTHKATWNGINTIIGRGKYPRGWSIGPTNIGQHFIIPWLPIVVSLDKSAVKATAGPLSPYRNTNAYIFFRTSIILIGMWHILWY